MDNQDFRLLVVDDNEDNLDMLSRRLQRRGFQVLTADGGAGALDILQHEPVDLVLLDIMMPGIDGLEVLRRTRQRFSPMELPIIMATAKAGSEDIVQTAELGANDHVVKPLNFKIVLAKVQALLRTKSQLPKEAPKDETTSAVTRIEPGGVLAGRYRLEALIGSGTFGAVYRAHHLDLKHDVAVKVLQPSVTANDETRRRFHMEGVAACKVQHPNAVRVTDFGVTDDGIAFLVMELLQGFPLVQEMRQWTRLSPRRCLEIYRPVCDVLAQAHRSGLVHRDIKPENIFLHQSNQGEVIKLLDFGIAKLVGENALKQNLTAEGWVLGTPAYMAPERLSNEGYDGRADVYSLGIMLFEMITGHRPFSATNNDPMSMIMRHVKEAPPSLRSAHTEAPEELEPLIHRCLAKQPDDRPTAEILLRELTELVESMEQEAADRRSETPPPAGSEKLPAAITTPLPMISLDSLGEVDSAPQESDTVRMVDGEAPTLKVDTDTIDVEHPDPVESPHSAGPPESADPPESAASSPQPPPPEAPPPTPHDSSSSDGFIGRWVKKLRGS